MEGPQNQMRQDILELVDFRIEPAIQEDYQVFADIIQTVWRDMPKKEWFVADNADYTYQMLYSGKGIGYKAVTADTGRVAGILLVTIPGMGDENLGNDIGLDKEKLPMVVHMESVAVLPEYRRYKLQYRLMRTAEAHLKEQGFQYLMCTVHPDNRYSRNNVISQGYRSMMVKEKYGGYIREIFLKTIGG